MSSPESRPKQVPAEKTVPSTIIEARAARFGAGLNVALVPGPAAPPAGDVQTLLRKRLKITSLIVAAGLVVILSVMLPAFYRDRPWSDLGVHAVILAASLVLVALLWGKRPYGLPALRRIELLLFGLVAAFFLWLNLRLEHYYGVLHRDAEPGQLHMIALARFLVIKWLVLIVGYGMLIPNTGRRCAAVVAALALAPLLVNAVLTLPGGLIERRLLPTFFAEMSIWLGIGCATAVFGCHRISVLQRQAAEARKLGQYQLKQLVGSGGMGEVYRAEHVLLRRPCAIKLIRPERAGDPNNLRRFLREVQATATLSHANTVQIFDYGHAEDGTFYYVMEYLAGPNLEQLVGRHGPLPPGRVIHLLRQVCGALREAHAIGLIHRDIKPSNIIACEQGGVHDVAKLLDFGLVRAQGLGGSGERLTQDGVVAGTPAYMSPEQAGGTEDLDARSDIYGLGAVAYFLLTGQPPFVRRTAVQVLAAHLGEPVTPLRDLRADLPTEVQEVVLRCLEKDPAGRYPDADSLEQALARCACADQWDRTRATAWWKEHQGRNEARSASDSRSPDGGEGGL